ncbi:MAG: hypothetical protein IIA01_02990 [Proteobacteria bacterium]|nr:hypothetical protein [Pseudomonadota bacterium]
MYGSGGRLLLLQFLHRFHYPKPHRPTIHGALAEHGVGAHSGLDWGLVAVLVDEELACWSMRSLAER